MASRIADLFNEWSEKASGTGRKYHYEGGNFGQRLATGWGRWVGRIMLMGFAFSFVIAASSMFSKSEKRERQAEAEEASYTSRSNPWALEE